MSPSRAYVSLLGISGDRPTDDERTSRSKGNIELPSGKKREVRDGWGGDLTDTILPSERSVRNKFPGLTTTIARWTLVLQASI